MTNCIICNDRPRMAYETFLCKPCFDKDAKRLRQLYGRNKVGIEYWAKLARQNGINRGVFNSRIKTMPPEEAATKPVGLKGGRTKTVYQYTKDGEFIAKFPSLKKAAEVTGVYYNSISACCTGNLKTAGGYVFKLEGSK